MLIIKVPAINGLGKTRGCEKAPDKITEKLKNVNIKEIKVNNNNVEETINNILKDAPKFLGQNFAFFLGGDHSISFPLVKSFHTLNQNKNKNPGLIIFDAHADCMMPMKEPTHEEWLRALIEHGFNPKNIILIGLRKVEPEEKRFLEEKGVNCFYMRELTIDFEETVDLITEEARKFGSLYISIDIDIIDPAFVPGTGYAEPGGLSSKEFLYITKRLALLKNLEACDLVEINPDKDINDLTVKLGAKIISEFLQ